MGFNIGTLHPLKKMVENNSNDGSNRDGGDDRPEYALEPKLFGKWSYDVDECPDISLSNYLQVKTVRQQVFVPYTAGRYQQRRFKKGQCPIVERMTCMLMTSSGRNNGKKQKAVKIIKQTMELIHLLTGENPVQIMVTAISHGGAREAAFRSLKSISETLADEIINASKGSSGNSAAVRKKDEIERVAKGNR